MTQHGNAKVRPDGKVNLGLAIDADLYRRLFAFARAEDMTMGEVIEELIDTAFPVD